MSLTTIYTATVGSLLHRTDSPESDVDIKSVHMLPLIDKVMPLVQPKPVRGENGDDETSYELSHFANMLLKNNATVVEVAASDLVVKKNRLIADMLDMSLDTEAYVRASNGYIGGLLRERNQTPKRVAHAVRMYWHLFTYIQDGDLVFNTRDYMHDWRQMILDIKFGDRELTEEERVFFLKPQEPQDEHHIADPQGLQQLVYEEYLKELI